VRAVSSTRLGVIWRRAIVGVELVAAHAGVRRTHCNGDSCAASLFSGVPWTGGVVCRPASVGREGSRGVNDPPPAHAV